MDDEYKLISAKLLELELRGNITQQEKATLASAISRILDEAIRKRDALAVVKIQRMGARLAVLKLEHPHDFKVPHYSASQFKLKNQEGKEKQKVFIVHGRNDEMKQAVTRVVERLGLAPVILSEKTEFGKSDY